MGGRPPPAASGPGAMLLIVGLGNPGPDYARHRHNVGAMAVDAIHQRHGFPEWRRRFQAEISEGRLGDRKAILLKPTTYMNESGRAVGEAARFYKIEPADIVVIHDELDLPPGKTRIKLGGGGAGHNGLRSVTAHLGEGYRRLRIGVGHPGHRDLVNRHVLHDFSKADLEWVEPLLAAIADNAALLAEGNDGELANRLHLALAEPAPVSASAGGSNPPRDEPARQPAEARGPFARLRNLFGGGRQ
jgi:PTH1 family peptidyl-tRNA hydrolase